METDWKNSRIRQGIGFLLLLALVLSSGCGKKDDTAALSKKLCEAVVKGYVVETEKLVREHPKLVNIPGTDDMTSTPLHLAVKNNRYEIAKLLLQNGADINARNKHGQTPLHLAAMSGNAEFAQILLSQNARKDIRDHWGQSALMYATKMRRSEVQKLLK